MKNEKGETVKYYVIVKPEGVQVVSLSKPGKFSDTEAIEQLEASHPTATEIRKAGNREAQIYRDLQAAKEQSKAGVVPKVNGKVVKMNGYRAGKQPKGRK